MITETEWCALSKTEKSALVRANWKRGISIADLAARIGRGISRNAVIGVYTRDKQLKADCPPNARVVSTNKIEGAKRAKVPTRAITPSKPIRYLPPEPVAPPTALMLPLEDLGRQSCKWPIGDPKQEAFGFCGVGRYNGSPYCPFHARLAYAPPSSRRA